MFTKETKDIIKELVEKLTVDIEITDVVDDGNEFFTLTVCNTYWITKGDVIVVDGNEYVVKDFVFGESLTVKPIITGNIPIETIFTIEAPDYFHGTLKMTKNEVNAITNKTEILPFVWLAEVIRDDKTNDRGSTIDRNSSLRIFFVHSSSYKDWLTEDHYSEVIYPLQSLVDEFISIITKDRKTFSRNLNYSTINLVNFSEAGNQDLSIFDCNLTAIELDINIQILKDFTCTNKC